MPFQRQRPDLVLTDEDTKKLQTISNSRKEPFEKVRRAKMLLAYSKNYSINSIAKTIGVSRPTVEKCVDKALSGGVEMALSDLKRKGAQPSITADSKIWVVNLACIKPKTLGLSSELWTISQLASYVRKKCETAGHKCLIKAGKSTIYRILNEASIKPHKIQYYLEKRDPEFEEKMAQVLYVYKEIEILNKKLENDEIQQNFTTLSYDEKPGIQAIENMAADLSPLVGKRSTWGRDYEYRRHGTLSLLAGIDLHDGRVIGLVRHRHRSREFIEFLEKVDSQYPKDWKLRIILDNHSSHISKETMSALSKYPNRFEFIFTPKHGSWLNLIEMFFSKMSRSFLRAIRVKSKDELKDRIIKYLDEINIDPVVFRWKYKLDEILV
ncbi:MAG: IS630 family transposase [Ignavibacteria bacterium]